MRNYFFANKWEGHRTLIFSVCSDVPNYHFLPTFAIGLQLNFAIQEASDSSECHTSITSSHIIIHFDGVATCPSFTGSSKFYYSFDPWRWCLAILPCQLAKKSILNQGKFYDDLTFTRWIPINSQMSQWIPPMDWHLQAAARWCLQADQPCARPPQWAPPRSCHDTARCVHPSHPQ